MRRTWRCHDSATWETHAQLLLTSTLPVEAAACNGVSPYLRACVQSPQPPGESVPEAARLTMLTAAATHRPHRAAHRPAYALVLLEHVGAVQHQHLHDLHVPGVGGVVQWGTLVQVTAVAAWPTKCNARVSRSAVSPGVWYDACPGTSCTHRYMLAPARISISITARRLFAAARCIPGSLRLLGALGS